MQVLREVGAVYKSALQLQGQHAQPLYATNDRQQMDRVNGASAESLPGGFCIAHSHFDQVQSQVTRSNSVAPRDYTTL
jgi:hypothetical protein